ncbi:purine-binding chemotaxis protein CheW [Paenibacillus sp. 19GGS1-52]|uniref:chemotaxis protein CheW n=1 Tax=Paenibacillus sp. 19GGS1-52 TaxID=2758563 RepID=UPI001EFA5DE5|nr:chemotaxis protein CheW [Paenibacillus sp. 19GGS1-52]ULO07708.1 purine-binding chemotaxis protein CheW [Paenibacillus sp. 19GGS1-52]
MSTEVQDELEEDTQKGKFLTFTMGEDCYGIEINHVREIIGIQPITQVPDQPEYLRGIINLRGKIIPVMDIRLRFGKTFRDYNDRTCIIVVDIENISLGLIVDGVSEVLSIPDTEIVAPPEMNKGGNNFIKGIGKVGAEVKLLLDCKTLLIKASWDEINQLGEK